MRLSPSNTDAHYVRASLLSKAGQSAEAIKEYERAAALRPDDYVLWLELGRARDQANDGEGALAAFRESTRLAPFYAKPHWQLGNILFRAGHRDEAFGELRRAATSDPKLLPQAIRLAWAAFGGEASAVEGAIQPQTKFSRLELARFFAEHGKAIEAMRLFRATSDASDEDRRALLAALVAAKHFPEAFKVWAAGHKERQGDSAAITDGSFESEIKLNEPGFGWKIASDLQTIRVSLDPNEPHLGNYSLRLDWSGESDPSAVPVSQLVLVSPGSRYRLSFAARTRDLITVGFPVVTVIDASDDQRSVLVQSKALQGGTTGWQKYMTEFTTAQNSSAVLISIRRENCAIPQCAILGNLWLDDFLLQRL